METYVRVYTIQSSKSEGTDEWRVISHQLTEASRQAGKQQCAEPDSDSFGISDARLLRKMRKE